MSTVNGYQPEGRPARHSQARRPLQARRGSAALHGITLCSGTASVPAAVLLCWVLQAGGRVVCGHLQSGPPWTSCHMGSGSSLEIQNALLMTQKMGFLTVPPRPAAAQLSCSHRLGACVLLSVHEPDGFSCSRCSGVHCVLQEICPCFSPPPKSATLFGNRVFGDVIKVR